MKPARAGLPGSVAVIGLIYVTAMADASETGLYPPTDPARSDRIAPVESHAALGAAGVPGAGVSKMAFYELLQAHRRPPNRPSATPGISRPAWGESRLTVF